MTHPYFDPVQPLGSDPARRDANLRTTYDENGKPVIQCVNADCSSQSPEGSVDSLHDTPDHFYHCGDPRTDPLGTKCAVGGCNRLSCRACSVRCERCLIPMCLEHRAILKIDGRDVPLCPSCRDKVARKLRWKAVGLFLLRPFVSTRDKPTQP